MVFSKLAASMLSLMAALLVANVAWGLGHELSETKEQLKLEYDLSVTDHGTGRVTINLTIVSEGRLAPLDRGVSFVIPSEEGTGNVDLAVPLERKIVDGQQQLHIHLRKDWAQRGRIQLQTETLDGKLTPLTWYYHSIPVAEPLQAAAAAKSK